MRRLAERRPRKYGDAGLGEDHGRGKLLGSVDQLQPRSCISTLGGDEVECFSRDRGQWWKIRVVLHVSDWLLPGDRNLHSGIQNPLRVKAFFHGCKKVYFLGRPR